MFPDVYDIILFSLGCSSRKGIVAIVVHFLSIAYISPYMMLGTPFARQQPRLLGVGLVDVQWSFIF